MESTEQEYCLRWGTHHSDLLRIFQGFQNRESFTDVTLICDGGIPIKCHRIVLAACSLYFHNLLLNLQYKRLVVVLKDIKYMDMYAILQYMHHGEVNIAKEHLAAFLKVAKELKVIGFYTESRSCEVPHQDASYPMSCNKSYSPISPVDHDQVIHRTGITDEHTEKLADNLTNLAHKNQYILENKFIENTTVEETKLIQQMTTKASTPDSKSIASNPYNHPYATATAEMLDSDSNQPLLELAKLSTMKLSESDAPTLRAALEGEQTAKLQSPKTDFADQSISNHEEDKSKLANPSSSLQSLGHDVRTGSSDAHYDSSVQQSSAQSQLTRKRTPYSLYVSDNMNEAIGAVLSGESVASAATKYYVSCNWLYSNLVKLGIPIKSINCRSVSSKKQNPIHKRSTVSANRSSNNTNTSKGKCRLPVTPSSPSVPSVQLQVNGNYDYTSTTPKMKCKDDLKTMDSMQYKAEDLTTRQNPPETGADIDTVTDNTATSATMKSKENERFD